MLLADALFPVDVLSRVTHVGTAIVLVGGVSFLRFVALPAMNSLPPELVEGFRDQIVSRWKRFVHAGIALFLISGFYNFFRAMPHHKGDKLYHALLGTKILIAFAAFFFASALVGRSKSFAAMRRNASQWLTVVLLLSVIIVAISGVVKVRGRPAPAVVPAATAPSLLGD